MFEDESKKVFRPNGKYKGYAGCVGKLDQTEEAEITLDDEIAAHELMEEWKNINKTLMQINQAEDCLNIEGHGLPSYAQDERRALQKRSFEIRDELEALPKGLIYWAQGRVS
ncbi:hypothetical protein [Vibrio harveyi]|uniref:hypothetical protein n=1 Tax=Vibrio harveyi TaxID=669 RepID=UPI0018F239A4|nr:hypothetical protein [Vibrio harveyi]